MTASDTPSPERNPAASTAAATHWIKHLAVSLGFDLVGVAPAGRFAHADAFVTWLQAGRAGTMHYMHRSAEQRVDPTQLLAGARSVIAVACSYNTRHAGTHSPAAEPDPSRPGRIAHYALGDDYHEVVRPRLHALADAIRQQFPGEQTRCCVDTAPILEREAAALAGLGWIGKNTCLVNPQWGSWLVLGEMVTTLALEPDSPMPDFCGTCTRCINACPTGAIVAPHELDARKCISYLTLEHRDPLTGPQRPQIGNWLVGCDLCQDACPWNQRARISSRAEFNSRFEDDRFDPQAVLQWTEQDYRQATRGSATRRVKLPVLKDRAQAVIENTADDHSKPRK